MKVVQATKKLSWSVLILTALALCLVIYYPVIKKPVPPGVDAAIYLQDVNWILANQAPLKSYQETAHGQTAYPSPLNDINLVTFAELFNLDIAFPLISVYQIMLLILLFISCFLVGKKYSSSMALLFPILTISSYAVSRLFIASTISNLLGFVYINFVIYLLIEYTQTKKRRFISLIFLIAIVHFLTHGYLSAPLFYPLLILFCLIHLFSAQQRKNVRIIITRLRTKHRIYLIIGVVASITILFPYYNRIIQEGRGAFFRVTSEDRFRQPITVGEYSKYLGYEQLAFGLMGASIFIGNKKNRNFPHLLFIVWPAFLFLLTFASKIGITFFYERILFLMGPSLSFFSAYAIIYLVYKTHRLVRPFALMIIFGIVLVTGINRIQKLYASSNLVRSTHIEALKIAKSITPAQRVIGSQVNAASQTLHDMMLTDRDIIYYPVQQSKCTVENTECLAFTNPELFSSVQEMNRLNITTIVILKPSFDGDIFTSELVERYRNSKYYLTRYIQNDAAVFSIINITGQD